MDSLCQFMRYIKIPLAGWVFHEAEIFEKVLSPSDLLKNFGPAGSSALEKVCPHRRITDMACRDVQAIFYNTKVKQIVANMLGDYSENIFTKMQISRAPVDQFW